MRTGGAILPAEGVATVEGLWVAHALLAADTTRSSWVS